MKIEASLLKHPRTDALAVVLHNISDAPIELISVHWIYRYETPQRDDVGEQIGGSMELAREDGFTGTLGAGAYASFLLMHVKMKEMMSQASVLSPEQYEIAVRAGKETLHVFPGNVVGDALVKHGMI